MWPQVYTFFTIIANTKTIFKNLSLKTYSILAKIISGAVASGMCQQIRLSRQMLCQPQMLQEREQLRSTRCWQLKENLQRKPPLNHRYVTAWYMTVYGCSEISILSLNAENIFYNRTEKTYYLWQFVLKHRKIKCKSQTSIWFSIYSIITLFNPNLPVFSKSTPKKSWSIILKILSTDPFEDTTLQGYTKYTMFGSVFQNLKKVAECKKVSKHSLPIV